MKRVMYVEEDLDTAEAVKLILENAGFKIELACSAKECMIKVPDLDLIMLDANLPDIRGFSIFPQMKDVNPRLKFAFFSSIPLPRKIMEELNKIGIHDYLLKPFKKEELIETIKKILD